MSTTRPHISGIQQIGLGIRDVDRSWEWYRKHLGMDLPVFDDAAEAALMLPYTGGKPRQRRALLALNMMGGGGLEIWQYTRRTPESAAFELRAGDLGIFCARFKAPDVEVAYEALKNAGVSLLSTPSEEPHGISHFYFGDPFGNLVEVAADDGWFREGLSETGGVAGCTVGVSEMERSLAFYDQILGYDTILSDVTGQFSDIRNVPGGQAEMRRVLLTHSEKRVGPFSPLLGRTKIELIQTPGRTGRKIFQDRLWGDLGYIHLCFDIIGMTAMRDRCQSLNYPFTVDSAAHEATSDTFDMGEAAGHFAYIEDPDGTLIEFVEAHRIPVLKKLNWYLDLRKRDRTKPLPRWMLMALGLNRVRD